jgi:4-hydroxybenzoate polyprenyltransferase
VTDSLARTVDKAGYGWALARVHRLEYPLPVYYLCYATWGASYAAGDVRGLPHWPVLLAVLANLLLPVAMNALNAAVDVRTDLRNPDKRDLATAVLRLGARRVIWVAAAEMGFSLVMATVVSAWVGHWFVLAADAAMIVLHLLYNLEPVHLKRRGFANPVALGISFGFLPCLVSYGAVRGTVDPSAWLVFAGLGTIVTGRALWWLVPDRTADAATGMRTPAVRYGAFRMLLVSCCITAAGPILLGWGLWWRYGPVWALVGVLASGAFLIGQVTVVRRSADRTLPNSVRMRRRNMTPMMIANVVLALLPLIPR